MFNSINDPYLNTVRRSLKDREYKYRKIRYKEKEKLKEKPKDFFAQEINFYKYLNLSESSVNTLLLSSFIFVPYITGIAFIFFFIAKANLETFFEIDIHENFVYWSIGYEVLAFMSILAIIKSAISFKPK